MREKGEERCGNEVEMEARRVGDRCKGRRREGGPHRRRTKRGQRRTRVGEQGEKMRRGRASPCWKKMCGEEASARGQQR